MNAFYKTIDQTRRYIIEENRDHFARDVSRILHCPSFRRLKGKTQVFPIGESDFSRDRLTHTLEVAEIGWSIANYLNNNDSGLKKYGNLNADIVRFACYAHDIGHAPFGHVGENTLDRLMKLEKRRFEGNAQSLRIIITTEKKEIAIPSHFDARKVYRLFSNQGVLNEKDYRIGLNLTYRSILSIIKYYGRVEKQVDEKWIKKGIYQNEFEIINKIIREYSKEYGTDILKLASPFKTIECDIMDLADDIAFAVYDFEDCLKFKLINILDLFERTDNEMLKRIIHEVEERIEEVNQIKIEGKPIYKDPINPQKHFGKKGKIDKLGGILKSLIPPKYLQINFSLEVDQVAVVVVDDFDFRRLFGKEHSTSAEERFTVQRMLWNEFKNVLCQLLFSPVVSERWLHTGRASNLANSCSISDQKRNGISVS